MLLVGNGTYVSTGSGSRVRQRPNIRTDRFPRPHLHWRAYPNADGQPRQDAPVGRHQGDDAPPPLLEDRVLRPLDHPPHGPHHHSFVPDVLRQQLVLHLAWVSSPGSPCSCATLSASSTEFNDYNAALFTIRARALNNLVYWLAQIVGSVSIGFLLDQRALTRRFRAFAGWTALFLMVFVVHIWAYFYQKCVVSSAGRAVSCRLMRAVQELHPRYHRAGGTGRRQDRHLRQAVCRPGVPVHHLRHARCDVADDRVLDHGRHVERPREARQLDWIL